MPRGPQILSPQQRQMLEDARAAFLAHQALEAEARAEYEALMERRLRPARARLARAVRDAVAYGVPRTRVNMDVLGVSTPNAWEKWAILATAYDGEPVAPAAPQPPAQPHYPEASLPTPPLARPDGNHWPLPAAITAHEHAQRLSFVGDPRDRIVRVTWMDYPSTAPDAPPILEGVAQYNPEARSRWIAVEDPRNVETPYGIETGPFTFEVEQRRGGSPLIEALDSYVAAANLPEYEPPVESQEDDDDLGF